MLGDPWRYPNGSASSGAIRWRLRSPFPNLPLRLCELVRGQLATKFIPSLREALLIPAIGARSSQVKPDICLYKVAWHSLAITI